MKDNKPQHNMMGPKNNQIDTVFNLLKLTEQRVRISGRVENVFLGITKSNARYAFINIVGKSGNKLRLVLWEKALKRFKTNQLEQLKDKTVRVSGILRAYKGQPQIEIHYPDQIDGYNPGVTNMNRPGNMLSPSLDGYDADSHENRFTWGAKIMGLLMFAFLLICLGISIGIIVAIP
ncbi:MAG TPA: OB-fold nucleic acid binding domain-containing protein [Elusimicrobiota bacterium]|nr:OB-fold nucleic acid binding domain-containing protein [Elusimicrobiota bacterium]